VVLRNFSASNYRLSEGLEVVSHKFRAMGSPCEIVFFAEKKYTQLFLNAALSRLTEIENKYTRYNENSLTTKINNRAGTEQAVIIDEETSRLLDYADTLFVQSDGLFDITSGVLRKAWNFRSGKLPQDSEVEQLLPLVGWEKLERTSQSVYLSKAGMEIDFGGFVKEYAADQLAKLLVDRGVNHGLINLGGDVKLMGPQPDGQAWRVGIAHPCQTGHAIACLPLTRGAVATSGDYERFIEVDGIRYCHLLNPITGRPIAPAYSSASIVSDFCVLAGSFSTIALLKSSEDKHWLPTTGAKYLIVNHDLTIDSNIQNKTGL
jgi:thiamine biosynthesis lipoprotein